MPRIQYVDVKLSPERLALVTQANAIIEEYEASGFDLTLRQLYYQFVARGLLKNRQTEYKRLGDIVNDARLAGLIDWDRIVDRTRHLRTLSHWDNPSDIISGAAQQYRVDLWEHQSTRVEVWIEKDALVGVIEGICTNLDVPYFSCRGYTSQSEMWAAARRIRGYTRQGQETVILHLGDHDPSGIDMTRDIQDRLTLFRATVDVRRIALTMDQIDQFNPPPNPAKLTDSRADDYIRAYGDESWELDALDPQTLSDLIGEEVETLRNDEQWHEDTERMHTGRRELQTISDRYDDVVRFLDAEE